MRRIQTICIAAAFSMLAGCAYDYGYGGYPIAAGYGAPVYYDGYYSPYWGPGTHPHNHAFHHRV
jgi:hypothetical protein